MSKYKDLYKTDSRFQPELAGFQDSHTNFCVIKDFRKRGSAVWGWNKNTNPEEKTTAMRCLLLAKSPIQVVMLSGADCLFTYSEYAPYTILKDGMEGVQMCISGDVPGEFVKRYAGSHQL